MSGMQTVELETGISAVLCEAEGEPRGGVVIIQEIFGVNAHIRDLLERLAKSGYTTIAPAFFDHVEAGIELDYDQAGMAKGIECAKKIGLDDPVADVAAAGKMIATAGRTGSIGFCWGGTVAMLAAQRLGFPSVCFYGARNVPFLDQPFKAQAQFHFGENDTSIPPDMVQAHRDALPDMEVFTYPGAGHGFNCDRRDSFHPKSATLAWQRTLAFFQHEL